MERAAPERDIKTPGSFSASREREKIGVKQVTEKK